MANMDLSEKSRSQKALLWSGLAQKLAHEIKNPLSTVLLTLQRLQMAYQEDKVTHMEKYDKYSQSALEEVERLRKVTDGFMKFTRIKPPEFKIKSVVDVINKIENRTREWLPDKVRFKVDMEENLGDIRIDQDQIQTLFYNLFDNAVKAMGGKGRLSLRVSLAEWIAPMKKEGKTDRILFEVSDTGCGISEDQVDALFEPYVSLREKGTGLGLTICKRIVEDHEGTVTIKSKTNSGTTVIVELPVINNRNTPADE